VTPNPDRKRQVKTRLHILVSMVHSAPYVQYTPREYTEGTKAKVKIRCEQRVVIQCRQKAALLIISPLFILIYSQDAKKVSTFKVTITMKTNRIIVSNEKTFFICINC